MTSLKPQQKEIGNFNSIAKRSQSCRQIQLEFLTSKLIEKTYSHHSQCILEILI